VFDAVEVAFEAGSETIGLLSDRPVACPFGSSRAGRHLLVLTFLAIAALRRKERLCGEWHRAVRDGEIIGRRHEPDSTQATRPSRARRQSLPAAGTRNDCAGLT
jgi:hypothetical protein